MRETEILNRWRLVLGKNAGQQLAFGEGGTLENGISCFDLEDALDFLYSREAGEDVRREGGTEKSRLTAATWITKIRKLFPKETVEILERHALERYQLKELLTDREVLEKLEPNQELLKTILQLKHPVHKKRRVFLMKCRTALAAAGSALAALMILAHDVLTGAFPCLPFPESP